MNFSRRFQRNALIAYGIFAAGVIATVIVMFWPSLTLIVRTDLTGMNSIPSEAMMPTLEPGDDVVTIHIDPAQLKRGTIIVFRAKDGFRVSRVAGLPRDTISLKAGIVRLNGVVVAQRRMVAGPTNDGIPTTLLNERFPGEMGSHRILDSGPSAGDDFAGVTVPAGRLFVLSDNRDRSADSRFPAQEYGAGLVDVNQIRGQVSAVYWARDRRRIGKPLDGRVVR